MAGGVVTIDASQLQALADAAGAVGSELAKELKTPINNTVRHTNSQIAKKIAAEVMLTQKAVKNDGLKIKQKATPMRLQGIVELRHRERFSLKRFNPRTVRYGISYKINKMQGRKTLRGAFNTAGGKRAASRKPIKKLNGHVFIRTGKAPKPIVKVHAVSGFGVYTRNKTMNPEILDISNKRLVKEVDARIDYLIKKRFGKLRGRQRR